MLTVEYTHHICMAHRLHKYNGKCSNIHGHNYFITFVLSGDGLDNGMIADFGDIKKTLGHWLDVTWDHALMLYEKDPLYTALTLMQQRTVAVPFNPTAENMAQFILAKFKRPVTGINGARLIEVRVEETSKCIAVAKIDWKETTNDAS